MQEDFATKVEKLGECAAEIKGLEELQGVYYDFKMARLYGTRPVKTSAQLPSHPARILPVGPKGDRVYVNVPGQFGIAIVHRKKRAVVAKWGFGGRFGNYPMALE